MPYVSHSLVNVIMPQRYQTIHNHHDLPRAEVTVIRGLSRHRLARDLGRPVE